MKPDEFIAKLDDARVVDSIAQAEQRTSGEIRVFVTQRELGSDNVMDRAASRFEKLGMTKTRERNAVLLYFAPLAQKYAIIGDVGVHQKCGQAFWDEVAGEMRTLLKSDQFTEAVVGAVAKVGEVLARHFPCQADDSNELPNSVERD